MHLWTGVLAIYLATDIPKRPTRYLARALDVGGVGLEEVDGIYGAVVNRSTEEGEEDE